MTAGSRERGLRQRPPTAGRGRARGAAYEPRSARAADASLGRPSAALESLANVNLLIREVARTELAPGVTAFEPDRLQQLRLPLFILDQGLRLAAGVCDLGRELLASIQGHR